MAAHSDIRVQHISFRQPIFCNCPTEVEVTLINLGQAPPSPTSLDRKFEVCLLSDAFGVETGKIVRQRVLGGESPRGLLPGQTLAVVFRNLVFLHPGPQQVTACADCEGVHPQRGPAHFEIGNDLHGRPCFTAIANVVPAAWLKVDLLEIDLEDSLGNRNRNVGQLCPGSKYVAIATVNNRGCAPAQNFTAQLTLLDQNHNVLDRLRQVVPIVAPLTLVAVEFHGLVPVPNAAGTAIIFQVDLDVTNVVQPQCNRQLLSIATLPIPVAPGGGPGPRLTLVVNSGSNSPIFPGDDIPISWLIQNDCSDLGSVTARVTLQGTGDLLHDSATTLGPIPVPPLSSGGEPMTFIRRPASQAAATSLYTIGAHTLHIEVTGTGRNPGPFAADAPLTITGEDVRNWWAWDIPAPDLHWKESYDVGGRLTNRALGRATVRVVSVEFEEFDDDHAPPTPTGHLFTPPPPLPSLPAAASAGFVWPSIKQDWKWLIPVIWLPVGPSQKNFGYTVDISLSDEFDNAYHLVPASSLDLNVKVTSTKLLLGSAAAGNQLAAIVEAAAALAALAGIFSAPLAAPLFGLAAAFEAAAISSGTAALDPPIPDFKYREAVHAEPPPLPKVLDNLPAGLAPLVSVLELIDRILVAYDALGRIQGKLLGARIDNNAEGLRIQVGGYQDAENLLRMAAAHLPGAVAEAVRAWDAAKLEPPEKFAREALDAWRRDGLPAPARESWLRAGLSEADLKPLDAAVRSPDRPEATPPLRVSLPGVSDALVRLARAVEAETPTILAGLPNLAPP